MGDGGGVGWLALGMVMGAILWAIADARTERPDLTRGHQRVRCAGCNRFVIKATCFDRRLRYFGLSRHECGSPGANAALLVR